MEKIELKIDGMTCNSCERLISKAVESLGGKVHRISASEGRATIEIEEGKQEQMLAKIKEAGYEPHVQGGSGEMREQQGSSALGGEVSFASFEQEAADFFKRLLNAGELSIERDILKMSVFTLLALFALSFVAYLFAWNKGGQGALYQFVLYGMVANVAALAAISQINTYGRNLSCMNGMMVGMTVGMMGGFLIGAVVGATNGMFVGSLIGMAAGTIGGYYCGRCCGIMGVLEGMMAGLMGGTMGAMLTVMMLADNLLLFMPVLFAACIAILWGLAFMMHQNHRHAQRESAVSFGTFFMLALCASIIVAAVIMYGPRASIVFGT
ncbi:hypothetical protein J4441_02250 [Candidatus Micrarchaeota archaeon]|nr:hypothetical protein [Candidatus Micrarchaeota archaeon]